MPLSQDDRPLKITTPLGKDVLLIQQFSGVEGISRLFHFQCEVLAENQTDIAFDQLLGQKVSVSVRLPKGERVFNGMVNRVSQGGRDAKVTRYHLELVPQLWLLSRRVQSRIFQHETVPDILKKVLQGLDLALELQGTFPKRDYCVQYRESDFAFASRLMEAEGIFYFFKHTTDGHKLVLANTAASHPDVPGDAKAIYEEVEGGTREDLRIHAWRKVQEIRAGKFTLWDHNFELPQRHLEVEKTIQESVQVGKVAHKLKVGGNADLELYDFPGGYAEWFDGVDKGGGDQPAELEKLFSENQRVAGIRMQQEAVGSLEIHGGSNCGQLMAGHKFALERHFNADGQYVLTSVTHQGNMPDYRSGQNGPLEYSNEFRCIPSALPYRPQRATPEPLIHGTQTAIVVGPAGETIFPDKYGRVKVQFLWDREWKKNADSSCWVRVSQSWGGGNWGGLTIPHVGQEVVIAFEDGDPDRPLIVGRVYNAEQMPPVALPAGKTQSMLRDHGDNQIIMEGAAGKQQVLIHSPTSGTTLTLGAKVPDEIPVAGSVGGSGSGAGGGGTGVPAPAGEPGPGAGANLQTADNVYVQADVNFAWKIGANVIRKIGGFIKDTTAGPIHKTILAWVSVFIGGFKTEVIVGMETKVIRGVKLEITNGTTIKNHKGSVYDNNPKKTQKTSGGLLRQIGGTASQFAGKWSTESKAWLKMRAAAKLLQQAKTLKSEAEGTHESHGKKYLIGAAGLCKTDAKSCVVEARTLKAKAKSDFNNGNLVIKQ